MLIHAAYTRHRVAHLTRSLPPSTGPVYETLLQGAEKRGLQWEREHGAKKLRSKHGPVDIGPWFYDYEREPTRDLGQSA